MRSALIVGIDSAIGNALKNGLQTAGWSVWGTSRQKDHLKGQVFYLDLAKADIFHFEQPIDVVYLCAGITKMVNCNLTPDYSYLVNVEAQIQLARYFLNKGAHIVYLSSNAVFNGIKPRYKIADPTCPVTRYGEHKAIVESTLLSMTPDVSIVRLTKVLTSDYPLILQWIATLKKNECIAPFRDLHLCPLSINTVTYCLKKIGEKNIGGITHLSGEDEVTYLDVAEYLAEVLGVSRDLIESRSMVESFSDTEVSLHTSLDMTESKIIVDGLDLSFIATMKSLYP